MRTTRKQLDGVVGLINETLGYTREHAATWDAEHNVVRPGYSIEAQSPDDGITRYRLHYYDGTGSHVADDCSWSWALGAAEFYGRLVAFLRGIEEPQRSLTRGPGREERRAAFKRKFDV